MGSIAEKRSLNQERHLSFERGCSNEDEDDDDDAFTVQTDATTVAASNVSVRRDNAADKLAFDVLVCSVESGRHLILTL